MDPMAVVAFGAIALALILVPGPDWAYILASGVQHRVVAPAVTGIVAGYVAITVVVVAGIGPVVAGIPGILSALTLAGAVYLLYLGVRVLQSVRLAAAPQAVDVTVPQRSSAGYLLRGFGVSALNPKGLLLFLSILPQFARPAFDWPMPVQFAVLGVVYILLCSAVYFTLGWSARRFIGSNPRFARITSMVAGIAMIALGLLLLAERVRELLG